MTCAPGDPEKSIHGKSEQSVRRLKWTSGRCDRIDVSRAATCAEKLISFVAWRADLPGVAVGWGLLFSVRVKNADVVGSSRSALYAPRFCTPTYDLLRSRTPDATSKPDGANVLTRKRLCKRRELRCLLSIRCLQFGAGASGSVACVVGGHTVGSSLRRKARSRLTGYDRNRLARTAGERGPKKHQQVS